MAAEFKSHVLMRDEKGALGIPFKRLLLAGVSGGFTYTVLRLGIPGWAVPGGAVCAVLVLVLTGMRGGLPLWQRLVLRLRGSLLLAAVHAPNSLFGQLATLLELPVDLVQVDGARVFAPVHQVDAVDLREWVTFSQPFKTQATDRLVVVDAPLDIGGDR